jgi:hypothetical protein
VREPVATVLECIHGVHLDAFHHEADVVRFTVLVEVCNKKPVLWYSAPLLYYSARFFLLEFVDKIVITKSGCLVRAA